MSKGKTILQWIEMLPDGYREICIMEYDPKHSTKQICVYFCSAIFYLCKWENSKIGEMFLHRLYHAIDEDNLIDYEKLPPLPVNWKKLYKDKLPKETQAIKKPKKYK